MPNTSSLRLSTAQKKRAKDIFSSPIASALAIVIAVLWTIPTFSLLVTSIRPESDINTSGWWTFFLNPNVSFENYEKVLFVGTGVNPPMFQYFFNSLAVTIPAVIFPITLAVFAAYALAWFDFKGMRDMIQVRNFVGAYPRPSKAYGNLDFGTVKGLTIGYDLRRTGNIRMNAN